MNSKTTYEYIARSRVILTKNLGNRWWLGIRFPLSINDKFTITDDKMMMKT